ncbi:cell envelope biogenesis protein OmpA [Pseudomonas sp. G11-1]|nr:cell envelope biogenesis protein OmpA [Pseudomonas sp. G11-1]MCO5790090.1 cell envelope biogenesis protein OmpA [Pseudomonas sp. G11-2]
MDLDNGVPMGIVMRVTALCALALLTGCASVSDRESGQPLALSEFDDVEVKVQDLGPGHVRQGAPSSPQTISQVVPGSSKSDVRGLLGNPANETNQRWWLYNINLPLDAEGDYLVCQYGVAFDPAGQVASTEWRRPQCSSRYQELIQPDVPDVEEITLFSDVLFGYDSATLSSEGLKELDLAAHVVANKMQLERVVVIGHSDRIGSDSYNDALSKRRAEAVRSHLISKGINSYLISAEGRGSREPLIECQGNRITASLKQCLQPNRRVQIMIYGQR